MTECRDEFLKAMDDADAKIQSMREMLLDSLTEKERKILHLRFGLGQEIEENFRATREKIRTIEEKTLKKLKDR